MGTTHTYEDYINRLLDAWGECFAYHRDRQVIRQKHMLSSLIDHKGFVPRSTGIRPMHLPPELVGVEDAVRRLHAESSVVAACLRAYYCSSGRRGVERYEKAKQLAGLSFSRRSFYSYLYLGRDYVAKDMLGRVK